MVKAIIQLLIGAMAVALAPIFVKLLTQGSDISATGSAFWRMSIGAIGFLAMIQFGKRPNHKPASENFWKNIPWKPLLLAGVLFALDLTAWHTSFDYTSIASSTLIANLSSIIVPICGIIFFQEPVRSKIIIGGAAAILGLIGLTVFKSTAGSHDVDHSLLWGEGLALLTAFFYTGYILAIKRLSSKYETRHLMFVSSAISAIILMIFCAYEGRLIIPSNPTGWVWILGLGLVSQVLGQGLVSKALSVLPVSQSALILLSAPSASAVFGWIVFHEALSLGQIVSVIITLTGIAIVSR